MKAHELIERKSNHSLHFTSKRNGYGEMCLYVEDIFLQKIYQGIEEHFNIAIYDTAVYGLSSAGELNLNNKIASSIDEFLLSEFALDIEEIIKDKLEQEEDGRKDISK